MKIRIVTDSEFIVKFYSSQNIPNGFIKFQREYWEAYELKMFFLSKTVLD